MKTNANGGFSKSFSLTKATTFRATATTAQTDTGCVTPLPATSVPGGCVGATIGTVTVSSNAAAAKPKKAKKK